LPPVAGLPAVVAPLPELPPPVPPSLEPSLSFELQLAAASTVPSRSGPANERFKNDERMIQRDAKGGSVP